MVLRFQVLVRNTLFVSVGEEAKARVIFLFLEQEWLWYDTRYQNVVVTMTINDWSLFPPLEESWDIWYMYLFIARWSCITQIFIVFAYADIIFGTLNWSPGFESDIYVQVSCSSSCSRSTFDRAKLRTRGLQRGHSWGTTWFWYLTANFCFPYFPNIHHLFCTSKQILQNTTNALFCFKISHSMKYLAQPSICGVPCQEIRVMLI